MRCILMLRFAVDGLHALGRAYSSCAFHQHLMLAAASIPRRGTEAVL
jgi:hypothetical protein